MISNRNRITLLMLIFFLHTGLYSGETNSLIEAKQLQLDLSSWVKSRSANATLLQKLTLLKKEKEDKNKTIEMHVQESLSKARLLEKQYEYLVIEGMIAFLFHCDMHPHLLQIDWIIATKNYIEGVLDLD